MYALHCAKILNELGTEIFLHINELLIQYNFFKIVRLEKSFFFFFLFFFLFFFSHFFPFIYLCLTDIY